MSEFKERKLIVGIDEEGVWTTWGRLNPIDAILGLVASKSETNDETLDKMKRHLSKINMPIRIYRITHDHPKVA